MASQKGRVRERYIRQGTGQKWTQNKPEFETSCSKA
jgi:hypothetical protein